MVFLFAIFLSFANAASKPFVQLPAFNVAKTEGNQKEQTCFLRQHLAEHVNFVVDRVIPRGVNELSELLQPQVIGDKKFHVAFATDYADLYHFHIRYPNRFPFAGIADFMNSADYHLQYHSLEHLDLIEIQWLESLQELKDPATQEWVDSRLKKATTPPSSYVGSGLYQSHPPKALAPLGPLELARLANLWDSHLARQSPGFDALLLRVEALNDVALGAMAISEIMKWRSVASHDDRYEILTGLDLPNVWQPTDLFFAKVSDNPKIAQEIENFSSFTGQTWVGNYARDRAELVPPSQDIRALADQAFQNILRLIEAAPDPLNTFKHVVLDFPNQTKAFAVKGDYIFALHYNLSYSDCPMDSSGSGFETLSP